MAKLKTYIVFPLWFCLINSTETKVNASDIEIEPKSLPVKLKVKVTWKKQTYSKLLQSDWNYWYGMMNAFFFFWHFQFNIAIDLLNLHMILINSKNASYIEQFSL